jgi:hypothetical protein
MAARNRVKSIKSTDVYHYENIRKRKNCYYGLDILYILPYRITRIIMNNTLILFLIYGLRVVLHHSLMELSPS